MEPHHVGHVMGVQRAGQNLQEHPRADVEQGEDVGDGEAAAGPLRGGLAEMGLESGVSGIENAEPSTTKTRSPSQRPVSCVAVLSESATLRTKSWKTFSGKRDRARQ